jgi:hypothetical protein
MKLQAVEIKEIQTQKLRELLSACKMSRRVL